MKILAALLDYDAALLLFTAYPVVEKLCLWYLARRKVHHHHRRAAHR